LRDYEADWLARINESTAKRVLVVGPTGSGKTVVAAQVIRAAVALNKRVLFIAHRRELVAQAIERLKAVGVEVGPRVTVTTIQSLYTESPPADLIVVDEAHHAPADSYRDLLAKYPRAIIHGLTATPFRCDGRPLDDLFQEIVASAPPSALIEAGWLSNPKIYTVPRDQRPKLLGLRKRDGDFDIASLARATDLPHLVGSVVEHYFKHAHDRPTVVYSVNIAHCDHMTEAFRNQGVRAATVFGRMPVDQRIEALEMFNQGELDVLVNCQLLTEGWDCPTARAAIVARPTLSASLWFQIVGRVTRPGPVQPIVLDHAGNALMHGMPLQDTVYSLKGRQISSRPDNGHGEKTCPKCANSVHVSNRECNWCGYAWWEGGQLPEVAPGQLELLARRQTRRRCAWPDCPTPNKLVHSDRPGAMHAPCLTLVSAEARKCQYEHCLTPDKLLAQNNDTGLHRWCRMHKDGKQGKPRVRCAYEKCPTPDVTFPSRVPGSMHRACERLVVESKRVCQYDKCSTPKVPLAHKAAFQGITMHRACKARHLSEQQNPDKPRCSGCGKARKTKLTKLTGTWFCDVCHAKTKLKRR
jgi:superfamily II DNA or RNA helicase